MKTSIALSLALGLLLAGGCNKSTRSNSAAADSNSTDYTATANTTTNNTTATNDLNASANRAAGDLQSAGNSAASAIGSAAANVSTTARMAEWKLNPSDIQADLDNNKDIVRSKNPEAGAPTGTTDKSVVESMVNSRLGADTDLAALKLRVSANKHGEVTLKGKAQSADEVGRAVALALDTEGVTKVTSKIKLDKDAKTTR